MPASLIRRPLLFALGLLALAGCEATVEREITYDERFGDSTTMDVFLPVAEPGEPRPAVMLVHGGSWRYFDRDRYKAVARRLARSGYVTASIDYRLVPDGAFPNSVHDTGCALAYLQNHADELGIDPGRMVLMGYSAGAHLSSLVAVADDPILMPDCVEGAPAPPAGVISGAGPQDMRTLPDARAVREFMGGTESERPVAYELASPVTHASADDPPFLFVHGAQDLFVDIDQSEQMRRLLRDEGVEAELLQLAGTGHVFNPSDDASTLGIALSTESPEAWLAVMDFLERTVGGP
jgi:acetyl esterase/lipase